jgi:CRISPR/Cas system-associated protein Cas10 (large subunit of type III CRISPR-Cas system)
MSSDQARLIAERIARRVNTGAPEVRGTVDPDLSSELAAVRETLNQLQNRLIQIESRVSVPRLQSPWLASHPSMERFGVEEATVSELVDFFQNEKACSLEPGGKPCDHCAMCSSRGF